MHRRRRTTPRINRYKFKRMGSLETKRITAFANAATRVPFDLSSYTSAEVRSKLGISEERAYDFNVLLESLTQAYTAAFRLNLLVQLAFKQEFRHRVACTARSYRKLRPLPLERTDFYSNGSPLALSKCLRKLRRATQLPSEYVEQLLHLPDATLVKWENGKRRPPPDVLQALLALYAPPPPIRALILGVYLGSTGRPVKPPKVVEASPDTDSVPNVAPAGAQPVSFESGTACQ